MRTDDLAEMLARNAGAEPQARPGRWWSIATALGIVAAAAVLAAWLGVSPSQLARMLPDPAWWGKAGFGLAMALVGLAAAMRLSRPAQGRWTLAWALVPLGLLWLAAAVQLLNAPVHLRGDLMLGHTWKSCPVRVAALSIPSFVAAFWVMRRMAPTRPTLAGAAAGLMAGGAGAMVYAFHCPELAPAFVAIWYVLGVAIPTSLGAVMGRWLLRW